MSTRTVYGNTHSENGWPMVDTGSCTWVTVPGTAVTLQIQNGQPLALLRAWAADWNAFVEPLRDADSACWTLTNDVGSSNHLSGSAVDLCWSSHRFHVSYDGFSQAQIATVREMLAFYENTIFWGEDWGLRGIGPFDSMHSQVAGNTYGNPHTADVIARKIRADGYSTFRRGNVTMPPSDAADVLMRATGITHDKAWDIMVGVINGLRDSECYNVNRIAMWLAQIGHESAGFNATEEYQSGDESTDRWKYKGRTWIQITWESNYAGLSKWAYGKGLIPSPTYFVDNPKKLAEIQYAGLGPAWYWVVARPQINSLCDQRNLTAVTQAINGGQNGAADRKRRYDMALALGDELLTLTDPTQGDDDLSAEAERMIKELYDEYTAKRRSPSRSFFATDQAWGETPLGFEWNMDGSIRNQDVTWAYLFGVSQAEELVETVANTGVAPASWAGQLTDAQGHWLAEWGQQWCQGLIGLRAAMQKAFKGSGGSATKIDAAASNYSVAPQVVYVDRPVAVPLDDRPVSASANGSEGQIIGAAYDALAALPSLSDTGKALLTALTGVLQQEGVTK